MGFLQDRLNEAKGALDVVKDGAGSVASSVARSAESVKETAVNSEVGKAAIGAAQGAIEAVDGFAERTGTKAAVGKVSSTVSDGFDSISGENVMRAMQKHLESQESLNDALVTRLHEALTRIESLERQLAADRPAL